MKLTDAQMRAIELILEQQYRLSGLAEHRDIPMDQVVREFFEPDTKGAAFERMVLEKIGKLLQPDTTEDPNLEIVVNISRPPGRY